MTTAKRPPARPAAQPAPAPQPGRMTIGAIRRGPRPAPDRILLVGTEGVGKSTFAASAPKPVFLAAEDGVRHLDVASFPEPQGFGDALAALRVLETEPHDFQTLVVDTVDWLEPLVWGAVCKRNGWVDADGGIDIEKPGYGKGYVAALEEWRRFIAALDRVREARGMEIILLAHASVKTFQNPAGPDYARYECKLQGKAAALVREWCDANMFAIHEEFVSKADGLTKAKGVSTGQRVLMTERCAAWDAKNRHGLPPRLPLDYAAYAEARAAGRPADPDALRAEIGAVASKLDLDEKGRAWLDSRLSSAASATDLAKLLNVLRGKLPQEAA